MPFNFTKRLAGFTKSLFADNHLDGDTASVDLGINPADAITDGISISSLLGGGKRTARNRQQILEKYIDMAGDPIISTALRLHVTAALGGHETSGDVVFIEAAAEYKDDKARQRIVDDIRVDLAPIFNRIANTVAFNGAAFGDAYGRIYTNGNNGVVDVYVDELVHPSLVTAYERGNTTMGFVVATGRRGMEKLDLSQMARMKMPRTVYVPQIRALEKAIKIMLSENDINKLPMVPALVGGSFMDGAEGPYDALSSTLVGLVGQRILDSIDESMLTVNMDSMTKEQRTEFMKNIKAILKASKARAEAAVASGKPVLSRTYNIMPVYGEKQLTALTGTITGAGRGVSGNISIEDVMFHAKMLSGAIGIDLSMLGFADLLTGGLGDNGYFRTSAQSAERSRLLRIGLTEFFNHVTDVHTFLKHRIVFKPNERPWAMNFYGTISSLEAERQRTRTESMNTTLIMAQALAALRELNLDDNALHEILTKIMQMDETQATLLVNGMGKLEVADAGGGAGAGRYQ